jgi:uncharacterized protein (TIGR00730 family)
MKNICVFCGSSTGSKPIFGKIAVSFGEILAQNSCELIYGGGKLGLMGLIAQSVLDHGGKVKGIIPVFMMDKEVAHEGLSELIITESMHERKAEMARLADGFVVLPGGLGTLDEMAEILTWNQIGIIQKPLVLLNTDGYYDKLLELLEVMSTNSFLRHNSAFHVVSDVNEVLSVLRNYESPDMNIWDHLDKT